MSVLQRISIQPNERLDCPDARAIDAYSLNDWRFFLSGFISQSSYILTGFEISNYSSIFTAPGFQVTLNDVVLFLTQSTTQAAGFYVFAGTEQNAVVNLAASSTNYVQATFASVAGSPDVRAFWDESANGGAGGEYSETIDTVINLQVNVTANISGFSAGYVPLYKVVTNSGGIVTSVTDCRPLLFRLGTGGNSPNPNYTFNWPLLPDATHSQLETPITSTGYTATNAPFQGGDKNITDFKQWMDSIMSAIQQIKSTSYWYSPLLGGGSGNGMVSLYQNAALTVLDGGTWTQNPPFLTTTGSVTNLSNQLTGLASTTGIIGGDYDIVSGTDIPDSPATTVTSIIGTTVTMSADATSTNPSEAVTFSRAAAGQLQMSGTAGIHRLGYETIRLFLSPFFIDLSVLPHLWVLLPSGDYSVTYGYGQDGLHPIVPEPITAVTTNTISTQVQYSFATLPANASVGATYTNNGQTFTVTQTISEGYGLITTGTGSPTASGTLTLATGSGDPTITFTSSSTLGNYVTGPGKLLIRDQTFTYSSYTPGTGLFSVVSPDPSGIVQNGDYVYQLDNGGTAYYHNSTQNVIPNVINGISMGAERVFWLAFFYPAHNTITLRFGEISPGETVSASSSTINNIISYIGSPGPGSSFPQYTVTATGALAGETNYNSSSGLDLTDRISQLTTMMADKAQDKTIGMLDSGYTNVVNTTSGANQLITFPGSGNLVVAMPGSANNGTIGLSGTLTLGTLQAAYFEINRNSLFTISSLNALTVTSIANVPIDENARIFAYRLSDTNVYLWDGDIVPVGTIPIHPQLVVEAEQNLNSKLINGGTWAWDSGTSTLSWSANANIAIPGLSDSANLISAGSVVMADGDVAYVSINRLAPGGTITVSNTLESSLIMTDTTFVIARRVGTSVYIGHSFVLTNGESKSIDQGVSNQNLTYLGLPDEASSSPSWESVHGAPLRTIPANSTDATSAVASIDTEIDKFFGQLTLEPHPTLPSRLVITSSDVTMQNNATRSQVLSGLLVSFPGAHLEFAGVNAGTIYATDDVTVIGSFSPPSIPTSDWNWFAIAVSASGTSVDNRTTVTVGVQAGSTPGSAQATTPRAAFPTGTPLGQVAIQATGPSTIAPITNADIVQLGTGSGGGGGGAILFAQEIPSGNVDGVNNTFTLSATPVNLNSLLVFIDDAAIPNSQYTLTGSTITFLPSYIPQLAQSILAYYIETGTSTVSGFQEVPAGNVDGINTLFSLSSNPPNKSSTIVFIDGAVSSPSNWVLIQGLTTSQINFVSNTPIIGQSILVFYLTEGAPISGPSAITAGANVGIGIGTFYGQSGTTLESKSLASGSGISLTDNGLGTITVATSESATSGYVVSGNPSSPIVVISITGVITTSSQRQLQFVQSSGGAQTLSAIPQVQAGSTIGQELVLIGTSAANYIILEDGLGLSLNGPINLTNNAAITLIWNSSVWTEISRR